MNRPVVVITAPALTAISGVTTHVNLLLGTALVHDYEMVHFQAGGEGLGEGALGRLLRLAVSPFALFATILFRHASVVHINTSMVPRAFWRDIVYLMVAKLLRARVVWQVHGGKLPQQFFKGAAMTRLLRALLSLPDVVVVLARIEGDAYRRFIAQQDVAVMPNGIDCAPYASVPTVRSNPDHPLRLVYVGRLAREKGLYELVQAMRLAAELGVETRLTLAGQGAEESRLKRYAAALGMSSRVRFAGAVFGDAKRELFAQADVFVLPSYSEGLPYALLEAMAAGMPVVATPVGAIPDVVTHGTHGFLVPARDGKALAEAIAALGANRDQLPWMSRACRRRVRAAYAIERLAADFGERYAALLGESVVTPKAREISRARAMPPRAATPVTERDR